MVEPHTHSRVLWRGDGRSSLLVQELCTRDTATSGLRRAGMRFGLNLCPGWFGFYAFAISCVPFSTSLSERTACIWGQGGRWNL